MTITPILTQAVISLFGFGLIGGLLLHDTNLDKAAATALAVRAELEQQTMKPGNMPHTHSERGSLYQAIRSIHASQPRTQPRTQDDKKYVQAKPSARGHHPFDNYTLPFVS